MVRIKHRYLLVDILHPEPSQRSSSSSLSTTSTSTSTVTVPAHLYFHPPTPDTLTSSVLARLLRDAVSELFGDYGAGKLGGASTGNLISTSCSSSTRRISTGDCFLFTSIRLINFFFLLLKRTNSQISISRDIHGDYTLSSRSVQDGVGCAYLPQRDSRTASFQDRVQIGKANA